MPAAVVAALLMPHLALACEGLPTARAGPSPRSSTATRCFSTTASGPADRHPGAETAARPRGISRPGRWPTRPRRRSRTWCSARRCIVRYGGEDRDRYGRVAGPDVRCSRRAARSGCRRRCSLDGLARVYSFADNRSCLATLLAAETQGPHDAAWHLGRSLLQVRRADRPEALLERLDHYELVEGRVLLAEAAGQGVYLNFGRLWKEDFTVVIDAGALKAFRR